MDTVEYCIQNITSRCDLLNCLMGFDGPVDPSILGYGRDEIEFIYLSGNYDWCTSILDSAVASGLIPDYRNPTDTGGGGQGDPGGDSGTSTPPPEQQASSPLIPLGLALWLITT